MKLSGIFFLGQFLYIPIKKQDNLEITMKKWLRFVLNNKRLLNFGFLYNFFSSFGQTFFISIFVPFWITTFSISNTGFGSIYAAVTVISAFCLSFIGKHIDKMPLKKFGLIIFIGLLASVIILSQAYHVVFLVIGLFLVRLFGQGLMTHTSATGIAKYFNKDRGKALGVTALGNPAGQLILPLLIMPLIASFGWRNSLLLLSVLAIIMIIPSLWSITPVTPFEPELANNNKASGSKINYFTSNKFWVLAINTFTIPFLCTAIFLYQYLMGKNYGWSSQWVTFSFAFYAFFYALSLLLSGPLVDRFTGIRLFPIYLLPTLLVLIVITVSSNKWVFPLFYALLGISSGLGSTIRTAVQVEIYGKKDLGKLRSYISTIMVLSTAAGPPIFGFFIDKNYSFNSIMLGNAVFILLVILVSFSINSSHAFKGKE